MIGPRGARLPKLLNAVGQRISVQGDMHIRVSRLTMRTILRAAGLYDWEAGDDEFREIDALALDALRELAARRSA